MNIKTLLSDRISMAMVAVGIDSACEPMVTLSTRPEFGDFQANGVLGAAKRMKTNPRALAEQVIAELDLDGIASKLELAGPGFINIHLADEFVARQVSSQAQHARLGVNEAEQLQKNSSRLFGAKPCQRNACGPFAQYYYWRLYCQSFRVFRL
jgi:arginyl-tRNA synthetase